MPSGGREESPERWLLGHWCFEGENGKKEDSTGKRGHHTDRKKETEIGEVTSTTDA